MPRILAAPARRPAVPSPCGLVAIWTALTGITRPKSVYPYAAVPAVLCVPRLAVPGLGSSTHALETLHVRFWPLSGLLMDGEMPSVRNITVHTRRGVHVVPEDSPVLLWTHREIPVEDISSQACCPAVGAGLPDANGGFVRNLEDPESISVQRE